MTTETSKPVHSVPGQHGYEQVDSTDVLKLMQAEVDAFCYAKGWRKDITFGEEIALLHSELSEALEAFRVMGIEERLEFRAGPGEGFSRLLPDDLNAQRWMEQGMIPKPLGVASELADTLVRLLDTCARHDIDLFGEFRKKMNYNWTRAYRHGGRAL